MSEHSEIRYSQKHLVFHEKKICFVTHTHTHTQRNRFVDRNGLTNDFQSICVIIVGKSVKNEFENTNPGIK